MAETAGVEPASNSNKNNTYNLRMMADFVPSAAK